MKKDALATLPPHLQKLADDVEVKRNAYIAVMQQIVDRRAKDASPEPIAFNVPAIVESMEAVHLGRVATNDADRLIIEVARLRYEEARDRLRDEESAVRQSTAEAIQLSMKRSYWVLVVLAIASLLAPFFKT